jgi:hypothetical protein
MKHDEATILKPPPFPVRPLQTDEPMRLYRQEVSTDEITFDSKPIELTLWQKIKLLPHLFTIIRGIIMQDMKTTISGIVKVVFMLATVLGISFGNVTETLVTGVIWGIVEIYQAFNTADKKEA